MKALASITVMPLRHRLDSAVNLQVLLDDAGLSDRLREFARHHPAFGPQQIADAVAKMLDAGEGA